MEISRQDLPPDVFARLLGEDDLSAAMALSQEAGWNQNRADWRLFLGLGQAIGLTRSGGHLIATAAILPHEGEFGWISMVLVTAQQRGRGLARWLLRRCIDDLIAQKRIPILDATPAGRMVYLGLGFQDCWSMRRAVAHAIKFSNDYGAGAGICIRSIKDDDWPAIAALDRNVFGADRSKLLRLLSGRLTAAASVAESDGRIVGYLLGRDGQTMNQLGPLVAADDTTAVALLRQALAAVSTPVAIDMPDRHRLLGDWLGMRGFKIERPLTRMVYGRSQAFDDTARLFAIAGPELG
jgi:GNAT superfamily N-acetyltransferase